jgi:hypothetical protein
VFLCKKAKDIGLDVRFITNGLLLRNYNFDELLPNIGGLAISLDSLIPCEQEMLWGISNSAVNSLFL